MDDDLAGLSREQLVEEVRKLRRGIREHRDSTGQAALLASSRPLGTPSRAAGPAAHGARLASVPPGLHSLSPVSRRATSRGSPFARRSTTDSLDWTLCGWSPPVPLR